MIFDLLELIENAGCIIKSHFHIYCPGCGGTRALEALLRLHIRESFYYNPLVILFLLDILIMLFLKIIESRHPNSDKHYKIRLVVHSLFLIFLVFFFLYRNYLLIYQKIDLIGDFSN